MADTLQLKGYQVPRIVVELLFRELDSEGCGMRKQHKLKRRVYKNPGPNAVWHADGYDKLKPYGFAKQYTIVLIAGAENYYGYL